MFRDVIILGRISHNSLTDFLALISALPPPWYSEELQLPMQGEAGHLMQEHHQPHRHTEETYTLIDEEHQGGTEFGLLPTKLLMAPTFFFHIHHQWDHYVSALSCIDFL